MKIFLDWAKKVTVIAPNEKRSLVGGLDGDPKLTSFIKHTKITTIYRLSIDEKHQTLTEKISYNERYK